MKLVCIINIGCDDITYGIASFSDSGYEEFKKAAHELNKNSGCQCQPRIAVCPISQDDLIETTKEELDAYTDPWRSKWRTIEGINYPLYFNGKLYVLRKGCLSDEEHCVL